MEPAASEEFPIITAFLLTVVVIPVPPRVTGSTPLVRSSVECVCVLLIMDTAVSPDGASPRMTPLVENVTRLPMPTLISPAVTKIPLAPTWPVSLAVNVVFPNAYIYAIPVLALPYTLICALVTLSESITRLALKVNAGVVASVQVDDISRYPRSCLESLLIKRSIRKIDVVVTFREHTLRMLANS